MKLKLLAALTLLISNCFAQNQKEGILLDRETKEPIEFVNIYNGSDYTVSNADGRYAFTSSKDSVHFYRVGYDKLNTTFDQLKDSIFLDRSVFQLNEVIITNKKSLFKQISDSLISNFVSLPYKEKFKLRALSKYNDEIFRIQDIKGKLSQNFFIDHETDKKSKRNIEVEVTNMRKVGRKYDERDAYLINSSLSELYDRFSDTRITEDYYLFKEKEFENGLFTKLEFTRNSEIDSANISGYYIINNEDLSINEFYLKSMNNSLYNKAKWLHYRTTKLEVHTFFEKDLGKNKYYLKQGKLNAQIETTDKERTFFDIYDLAYILETSDNFSTFDVKKNIKADKDVFKLKHPYNESYWNSQNQLLLTEEMQEFITSMGSDNKEFKVRSNMD